MHLFTFQYINSFSVDETLYFYTSKEKSFNGSIKIKVPYLNYHRQQITGRVLCVLFDKRETKFEMTDYIKTSKKHRTNIIEVQQREILQYNFTGLCIAHKKDPFYVNTSFLIRNTFDRTPYELNVCLNSPIIEEIYIRHAVEKIVYITHSKYYYLRNKPMPKSTIFFDYIVDMYDHDIIHEKDPYILAIENLGLDDALTMSHV